MTVPHRALLWLLAALWLALALPHVDTRYSFAWDSSQFERGVRHFDIALHQPHPPGYPLWILALRGLAPIAGPGTAANCAGEGVLPVCNCGSTISRSTRR